MTFEFVKKNGRKFKVTSLGTAALRGGAATLSFKPNQVLKQAADDHLQRRSRLSGEHDEPAQADEEGDGVAEGANEHRPTGRVTPTTSPASTTETDSSTHSQYHARHSHG